MEFKKINVPKEGEKITHDYKGNLILLNFWATWCAPCKEEMPSLDLLQVNKDLDNLKIFPINFFSKADIFTFHPN